MQVTGGKISFTRTVKPADYEGRGATVELSFNTEDGTTTEAVETFVAGLLASAKTQVLATIANDKAPAKAATAAAAPTAAATATTKRRTKADIEAEKKAELAAKAGVDPLDLTATEAAAQISTGEARNDPAQGDPDGLDTDPLELTPAQEVKQISDKELTDVVTRVNSQIKAPDKIKQVRAKYTTGAIATIAHDKRAAFIKDIEALLPK